MHLFQAAACGLVLSVAASSAFGAEPEGEGPFALCGGCHQIGGGAVAGAGPVLNDIHGRAAAEADFPYSEGLMQAAADGLVWTDETLDAFLADPTGLVPGTTMAIAGIESAEERAAIIAFLKVPHAQVDGFAVSAEILSIEGDLAYGEYLAGECTSCHRAGGTDIPAINGWAPGRFVTALHAYREGARSHPVMQMVAGRLGDEEIAALAAYFATLD